MIKNESGFSIVEILVAMAVIGILSTLTVVAFTGKPDEDKVISRDESSQKDIASIPITAIGMISGTPSAVGNVLTAGAVAPSGATVTYQWQSAIDSSGPYIIIPNANEPTYKIIAADAGKYLRVVVSGTGKYTGDQTSINTSSVPATVSRSSTQTSTVIPSVASTDIGWLTIGTQVWAKTNLNVGTMVKGVTNQSDNSILEKYCYNNLESNCATYGALYQWNEAMQYVTTEGAQGICPTGSHIPSDNDWKILEMQLGMSQAQADDTFYRGTDQGTKLKADGSSGLNIPFAGNRDTANGSFYNHPYFAALWSSSESSSANAWGRYLLESQTTVNRDGTDAKGDGFSVRCLKN